MTPCFHRALLLAANLALCACANVAPQARRYVSTQASYVDTHVQGPVSGVGVESQDIDAMADRMARDLLATPLGSEARVGPGFAPG